MVINTFIFSHWKNCWKNISGGLSSGDRPPDTVFHIYICGILMINNFKSSCSSILIRVKFNERRISLKSNLSNTCKYIIRIHNDKSRFMCGLRMNLEEVLWMPSQVLFHTFPFTSRASNQNRKLPVWFNWSNYCSF